MIQVKRQVGGKKVDFESYRAAAEAFGVPYITFYHRVYTMGWSVPKALKTPVRRYKKNLPTVSAPAPVPAPMEAASVA